MLRSHPLRLQRLGLRCRLVDDPVAFVREGNLSELLPWVSTSTKRLQRLARVRDIQSERPEYWDDPALTIARTRSQNAKHEMFGADRGVVEDARSFILRESNYALRVVVVHPETTRHPRSMLGRQRNSPPTTRVMR